MLTGDNHRSAEIVRNQLGITQLVASFLPEEKQTQRNKIKEWHASLLGQAKGTPLLPWNKKPSTINEGKLLRWWGME